MKSPQSCASAAPAPVVKGASVSVVHSPIGIAEAVVVGVRLFKVIDGLGE